MAVVRKMREEEFEPQDAPRASASGITETQILELVNTALKVIGARLLLIVGLIGAIALAYLALQTATQTALWAQSIFSLTVFIPLVWLSTKRVV